MTLAICYVSFVMWRLTYNDQCKSSPPRSNSPHTLLIMCHVLLGESNVSSSRGGIMQCVSRVSGVCQVFIIICHTA